MLDYGSRVLGAIFRQKISMPAQDYDIGIVHHVNPENTLSSQSTLVQPGGYTVQPSLLFFPGPSCRE
ncbi:jg27865 [Pararge aegeria aegeria]|uniref:Jg27865 protein n=1 Tax=Pararge aegeria aegeria TaxID=348720 RepID=A0A8S4QUN2_9NEOP|nr:jg27865 [Pararge aegeria aegeria]